MQRVIIVDFGSQYTHLIARRIRELNVYSEIIPFWNANKICDAKAIILSGGPMSVYDENSPKIPVELLQKWIENNIPILGICYGHQLLAHILGGRVVRGQRAEYGATRIRLLRSGALFRNIPSKLKVWMSHKDVVLEIPEGFKIVAETENSLIAAYENSDLKIFGVQFHPEVEHTDYGLKILDNFLRFCKCERVWEMETIARTKIENIRRRVGSKKVLVAVSGGVDSTTLAYLLKKAIGDNLYVIFINTGFLREGEPENVLESLKNLGFKNIVYVDASEKFLSKLIGVSDPEEKRKIFAKIYAEVLEEVARNIKKRDLDLEFLAQGTIYPDRIESGVVGARPSKIKSHHNVIMPTLRTLKKLEPLADLYKDEVRKLAKELGIPKHIYNKQPFPGPGLLIRVVGKVTKKKLEICRKAHKIVEEETSKLKDIERVWQIFPVVLSDKTTGIKGDKREYGYIVVIRAVISSDGMTADVARLPWDFLERVSRRITGEIDNVCRVLYDITSKPPSTIEFE